MKGGLAIHAALFEQYAKQALDGTLEGSIMLDVYKRQCSARVWDLNLIKRQGEGFL